MRCEIVKRISVEHAWKGQYTMFPVTQELNFAYAEHRELQCSRALTWQNSQESVSPINIIPVSPAGVVTCCFTMNVKAQMSLVILLGL